MQDVMLHPHFVAELCRYTYSQVKATTTGIAHSQSLLEIVPGVNCLNWLVEHIVVARCNFLMFLNVPPSGAWNRSGVSSLVQRRA